MKVVFSKEVEILEPDERAIAVDINENNVTFGTIDEVKKVETKERVIRTVTS